MKKTSTKPYFSTTEVAKILGVSRIAIFHKIKKGQLEAERYGRNYLISHEALEKMREPLTDARKREIDQSMNRIIKEYGEALRMLGKE